MWRGLGVALLALWMTAVGCGIGPARADDLDDLSGQVLQLYRAGRFAEAVPLAERLVELSGQRHGTDSKAYAAALYGLGNLLIGVSRYADAETALRRAIPIFAGDPESRGELARARVMLSSALVYMNKLEEGVALMRSSVEELAAVLGPMNPLVIVGLNNLAQTLHATGRPAEAEPIYRRLIGNVEGNAPDNFTTLGSLHANLAAVLQETNRPEEALAEMRRAVEYFRRIGNRDHPFLATALNNLGFMESSAGRRGTAEELFRDALAIIERTSGRNDQSFATTLMNLAMVARDDDRLNEAEALTGEALATFEKTLGPEHPKTITAINSLALLLAARGEWAQALALHDRASELAIKHEHGMGADREAIAASVYALDGTDFPAHMRAIDRVGRDDPARRDQAFKLFQRSFNTRTAAAVSQMAARIAAAGGALSTLVREQQDLGRQRARVDQALIAALGARGDTQARQAELRTELQRIDAALAHIGGEVREKFPDYTTLIKPDPVSLADLQRVLRPDEAFVGFLEVPSSPSVPAETHAWVVTRDRVLWRRLDTSDKSLGWRVPTLRCGLDTDVWMRPQSRDACRSLTGVSGLPDAVPQPLPFNLGRAHELYQELFAPFKDVLRTPDGKWRHLLVVVSGPLSVLPLQTLVTEQPAEDYPADLEGYGRAKWLGTRQPLTMLPSVASLTTLRNYAKASKATRPFVGFGNPLLAGPDGTDQRAWSKQACARPGVGDRARIAAHDAGKGVAKAFGKFFRGGLADVEEVRLTPPLPETADELCTVARAIGAGEEAVNLGERATEARVKALSADGTLATARIVHFATHGLLAGETQGLTANKAEPSLMLTPPATASEADDGLLTASEIANLKLDADWVILSACNTAAGDQAGIEAFSGLARAFFYAGARALLVSHWYVDSAATVELVTRAFAELKADPKIGRAEAMRRAMSQLIADGGRNAHPANWAPFVVVGEGAGAN